MPDPIQLPAFRSFQSPSGEKTLTSIKSLGRRLITSALIAVVAIAVPSVWGVEPDAAKNSDSTLPTPTLAAPMATVDLKIGESADVQVTPEKKVRVTLLDLQEQRDTVRGAVRRAVVKVKVDDATIELVSANYRLPVEVSGVRIDCPITTGYPRNSTQTSAKLDPWGLDKDARLRLWPVKGPLIDPETFQYPVDQAWFASATQMANEPTYVDGGEKPGTGAVYYHYGLDIGGAEGRVSVAAATDGLVVSLGVERLAGFEKTPVAPRYDVVYLLDSRGWYYRYSHLQTIDSNLKLGARIPRGHPIGVLGKEGGSGGWSHLHFDISGRQPSGKWGIIDGYAFLWEAAIRQQQLDFIAVARPHLFAVTGQTVTLDGARSWSAAGPIAKYQWRCGDGQTASSATFERQYTRPGVYSEILEVTDTRGRVDYDFAIVHILDAQQPDRLPPSIHAAFAPSRGVKAGDEVTFFVRTFRTTDGEETWDFGDGSPPVQVRSDGNAVMLAKDGYARTTHRFAKPGTYLAKVERTNRLGYTAVARLKVVVGE
jgi:murein DD-endopeptidase MepM/ murein hydrolase activator NlpD